MNMVQRKFYLPEDLYTQLTVRAKITGKTITEALRELLRLGLQKTKNSKNGRGTKALLELAKFAEANAWKGPKDLSSKHDAYFSKST